MTLLIATPIRGAELWSAHVTAGYSESVRMLAAEMPVKTIAAKLLFTLDVVRARNRVVSMLLTEPDFADVSHVLWWDDDQWPEDRRIVREMMALNEPIVAAPYTNKRQPVRWIHQPIPVEPRALEPTVDEKGLLPVRAVGMGFTMVSRTCIETMAHDPRTTWYTDLPNRRRCPNLFGQLYDTMGGETVLLSEDFSFCKRWREEHGGRIALYTRAGIIFHSGAHAWSAREMPGGVVG